VCRLVVCPSCGRYCTPDARPTWKPTGLRTSDAVRWLYVVRSVEPHGRLMAVKSSARVAASVYAAPEDWGTTELGAG